MTLVVAFVVGSVLVSGFFHQAFAQSPLILNLGGEGELPGAINVNLATVSRSGRAIPELVVADLRQMPIASGSVDQIVCNKCPCQGAFRFQLAAEAARVLKSGGSIAIWSVTRGGETWLAPLKAAGFINVREQNGRALAEKP